MLINEVIQTSINEGPNDPHIFKAIFLAGGPGSGKGFVARQMMSGYGVKTVNSDDVYEKLAQLQNLDLGNPDVVGSPEGQEAREKAKRLTDLKKKNYLAGRLGVIIDGTAKDVAKTAKMKQSLDALGYDTMMVYVNTSLDVAQQRNTKRARTVPNDMVAKMWHKVQDNLMKFQQLFGNNNFYLVDNSGGLEDNERRENFVNVEKAIRSFVSTPPNSRMAKAWLASQQQSRAKSNK